jgi:hypothetical protein
MAKIQRHRAILLIAAVAGAAVIAVLVGIGGAAAARQPSGGSPTGPKLHEVTQSDAAVRAYWTPERMADAQPAPMDINR